MFFQYKKMLALTLAFCMIFSSISSVEVSAKANSSGEWYGELKFDKTKKAITDCASDAVDVVVPSKIDGVAVEEIEQYAFAANKSIRSVVIPDGIKEIQNFTFNSCDNLIKVVLPESVEYIGSGAFFWCKNLQEINMPENLKKINSQAFDGCKNLKEVILPNGFLEIQGGAFNNCDLLEKFLIPPSTTSIYNGFLKLEDSPNLVIYGAVGSKAEKYALGWGIPFEAIGGLIIEGESSVKVEAETTLRAICYDENGDIMPENAITWSCNDDSIVKLTSSGNSVTVKGLKGGKTTITATHAESGQSVNFEIEVISYVMTLAGEYAVLVDEEFEINYAVQQDEEYVHNDLDIKWEIESESGNDEIQIISDKDNTYTRALTIKGLIAGKCELVAKVDGLEIGRTSVEVLGNLAETIEEEVVYRANVLKDNYLYKFYKNEFTDLPEMLASDMNKNPAVLYNAINDVFKAPTDRTNFYEIVLLDILTNSENVNLLGDLSIIVDNKIFKHAAKQVSKLDFTNNETASNTTVEKMFDELLKNADDVGKVKVADVLDGLYTGKDMIEKYIETVSTTYSLGLVSNAQIRVLEDIRDNATNSNLKEACDNVMDMYYNSSKDGVSYAAQLGAVESGYKGVEFAAEKLIDVVCNLNWVSALYKGAFDVGKTVSNLAYNADDLSTETLKLIAYAEIGDDLKELLVNSENAFSTKQNLESASEFMSIADMYKVCLLKGCDAAYDLVGTTAEAEKTSATFETAVLGVLGLAKQAITGIIDLFNDACDYEHTLKTITNIKKEINLADFYGTDEIFIVTFNSNGGSMVIETDVPRGENVLEPDEPMRSGYTFTGWYTSADCAALYNFDNRVTEDMTLYAGWKNKEIGQNVSGGGGLSAGTLGQGSTNKKEEITKTEGSVSFDAAGNETQEQATAAPPLYQ